MHEVLHALSEPFAGGANGSGCHNLVEGIDQWLTLRVMTRQLKHAPERKRTYGGYTDFAEVLGELLGAEAVRAHFLGGWFSGLERDVDGRRGRGALRRACRALENNDFYGAMQVVAASPRWRLPRESR